MASDRLELGVSLDREYLDHLRRSPWAVADADRRVHAVYATAFNGTYRIEVGVGADCSLVVEHISGATHFEWHLAEYKRRLAMPQRSDAEDAGRENTNEPTQLPATDEHYLVDVVSVDEDSAQALVETVVALRNAEQLGDTSLGRDGFVVAGGLHTGGRDDPSFIAWAPTPDDAPGACSFAWAVWSYAMAWTAERVGDRGLDPALTLRLVQPYLASPDQN